MTRDDMRRTLAWLKRKGKIGFGLSRGKTDGGKNKNGENLSRRNWCVTENQHPRIRAATDICHLPGRG